MFAFFVCSLLLFSTGSECARILGVFTMPAPSHFFLGERIFKALAEKGHQVTMINPFPQKTPIENYRDISTEGIDEEIRKGFDQKVNFVEMGQIAAWKQAIFTQMIGFKVSETTLKHKNVQQLLSNKNETFDAIIMELFHTEIMYGLAHHYNCPIIVLSTMGTSPWTNSLVANPAPSSYVPDLFLQNSGQMGLFDRLYNLVNNVVVSAQRNYLYFPQVDTELHAPHFFPDAPPLDQLIRKRTALILLNSHPAVGDARPIVPSMIQIGGFHIQKPKPLPSDLQKFMDAAPEDGVILFSMGSNFRSADLSNEMRDAILKSFGKLKQQVIWKFEEDDLPGKPANVRIMKWCPQNDLMAHPKLKAFVTHGGLLSLTEAIYHGVPMIGIPIFGDQYMNIATMASKGYGIPLYIDQFNEQTFSKALKDIIENPKYRTNAKRLSSIFHDEPMKPLDRAIFWIEFVTRHNDFTYLQTSAIYLNWVQLYMIDIILFIIVADIVLFIIFYLIIKRILGGKKCCKATKTTEAKKKN